VVLEAPLEDIHRMCEDVLWQPVPCTSSGNG